MTERIDLQELKIAEAQIKYERRHTFSGIQDDEWYEHPTLDEIWERAIQNKKERK